MRTNWTKSSVAALFAAVGLSAMAAKPEPAYKVIDADIVVSDAIAATLADAYGWNTRAICDLTNGMARTTGRCPAVYAESKLPAEPLKAAVYVGETVAGRVFSNPEMRALDFRMVTQKGATYIIAKTSTAVSYGVGEYLRRVCDYWFVTVAGDDPAVFNPDLVARTADIAPRPTMYYRYLEHGMYDGHRYPTTKVRWEDWNRRTRLECNNREIEPFERLSWSCGRDCHTSFLYCPPATYFKDHPEYYSMVPGGRRQYQPFGQFCYSNPHVKEIVYDALVAFIEKDRMGKKPGEWPTIYDFSQEDNTSFICTCPECRKIIEKYTTCADQNDPKAGHNGGDCGLVLSFVNDLARRIAKKYPDVTIRMFAYVSTENPPKDLKPEENVLVWLCDLYSQCSHELPLEHPFNAATKRDALIADWSKLAKRIELWDYMLYDGSYPEPNVDAIAADAKFFEKVGLGRYFMESEYRTQPFWELNMFVVGELMFNPKLSVDGLVRRYCRVYGKGANDMEKAISFLRDEMQANPPKTMPDWHGRILPWLTVETIAQFRAHCEAGYAKESEGAARGRIAKVLASTCRKQMALYRSLVGKDKELAEVTEAYRTYAKEDGRWTIMEEKHRAGQPTAVDAWIERQNIWFDDLPSEFQSASRADVHCIDRPFFEGEGHAKYVDDTQAFGGRALFEPHGGRTIPCGVYDRSTKASFGLPINLPKGDLPTDRFVWRKVGVAHIDGNSIVWLPGNWNMSVYLKDFFVFCDGADRDLDWYEFWVSMKLQGPAFNSNEPADKKNGFMFDRWAIRRVDEPKKAK